MPFCQYCGTQIVQPNAKYCPNCGKALTPGVAPIPRQSSFFLHPGVAGAPKNNPAPVAHQKLDSRGIFFRDERVEWEKDFKDGLLHRHVERAYIITNLRVISLDMVQGRVMVSLPIRDTDVLVLDRNTSSTPTDGGTYQGKNSSSTRTSSSKNMGSLVFTTNGVERIRFGGIGDPDRLKNLFNSIKRDVLRNEK